LTITATWRLTDDNALHIDYEAISDAPTIVNITNHAYWNLAGEGSGSAMAHHLQIMADQYLPVDAGAIPTGELRAVAGTAFDFRDPTPIEARLRDAAEEQLRLGRGYDHNWVLRPGAPDPSCCRLAARLADPASGRWLEVHSDQPGLQFYSGNFLDGSSSGKSGRLYRMGDGVSLEPQRFPDAPNQPHFGSARLDPGETYAHRILLRFGAGHAD
jgi:aldose 1-epimerase